jgi:hypothetical protein
MLDFRLLTGALVTVAGAVILIGFQLFGSNAEVAALVREEAPPAEWLVIGKLPPAQPRVAALAPAVPSREQAMEWLAFLDIVHDTKMDPPPAGAEPARIPLLASANMEADTRTDYTPSVFRFDFTPRPIAGVGRVGLEFAGPPAAAKVAAAIDTTKSDDASPETTGSITPRGAVKPPQPAQAPAMPPAQARPAAQPNRYAARPAQPAETKPETLPSPLALFFPFAGLATANGEKAEKYPPRDMSAVGVLTPCCRRED